MGRSFSEFMEELRTESKRAGKDADMAVFEEHFRLARQLAQRRQALHLSQKALSSRTGIDQSEISRLERGTGNPTLRTLSTIASALDGRVNFVFTSKPASRRKATKKAARAAARRSR